MKVTPDSVAVEVEFSHPTYLRILHYLESGDGRFSPGHPEVDEWLKTLAWVQMQRGMGRYETQVVAELPEEVRTNIMLYQQHQATRDKDVPIQDSINEFVELEFDELIDMNDLDPDKDGDGDE